MGAKSMNGSSGSGSGSGSLGAFGGVSNDRGSRTSSGRSTQDVVEVQVQGPEQGRVRSASPIPWRDMVWQASANTPISVPPGLLKPTKTFAGSRTFDTGEHDHDSTPGKPHHARSTSFSGGGLPKKPKKEPPSSPLPKPSLVKSVLNPPNILPTAFAPNLEPNLPNVPALEPNPPANGLWNLSPHGHFHLALYVAMAHAGLAFLIAVLFGLWKLLEDYWEPIQWAILCSMPLREVQEAMVAFWEPALKEGLFATLLAVPSAICKALIGTILDIRFAAHSLTLRRSKKKKKKVGFSTLMQWLVSFAFFTLGYEFLGPSALVLIAFVGMIVYAAGISLGLFVPVSGHLEMQANWSILSSKQRARSERARSWLGWAVSPFIKVLAFIDARLTRGFVGSLRTFVAIWLISMMIVGSLSGLVFFSYKAGLEGKAAVIALKSHVTKSNYAERVGLKQVIEDYKVPELIDSYSTKAYEAVSRHIDVFAEQYNMTELANAGKSYILGIARGENRSINASEIIMENMPPPHPVLERLHNARLRLREYDIKGIYLELELAASIMLEHFQMSREDLVNNVRQLGQRWLDVGKQILARSSTLMTGSTYFLFSICRSIASGAAGLFNFVTQAIVFFYLLYYLITSKSGGVMEQVLDMVPLSASTRRSCASLLDHTVSSVLLGTVKAAIFQAAFTWLLFRFFNIHFLYMSTFMAFFSAVFPVFPGWFCSLPAGAQLAFEGQYVQAICLMIAHVWVMDYGVSSIQHGIPGHNAYFTGLSIAGGMAVFTPALEGAIMGPLVMTLLISVKNLYSEFVLAPAEGKD